MGTCALAIFMLQGGSAESQQTDLRFSNTTEFTEPIPPPLVPGYPVATKLAPSDPADPFGGYDELPLDLLVNEVLVRNPSLAAAQAVWRAAAARYPQVVSLDDPMLDTIMAPGSIGARDVDFAYAIQARQKVPWFGKRQLRGQVANWESRAANQDVGDARLQLVQAAKQSFYEYFVTRRLLELNAANRQTLAQFRGNALTRYESNLVTQQDVLLAEVELAELDRRDLELRRNDRVAVARINTLLLRAPGMFIPPPPASVRGVEYLPEAEMLLGIALQQRPDLAAALSRLRAEQAGIAVAEREFKPDLEFVGRYDTFWLPQDRLVGQVGVTVNIPLQLERRRAAVREASSKAGQRRAELDRLVAQVQFEVQEAYENVTESRASVLLYKERILPAATQSVATAQSTYESGKLDFLRLVEAQRQLIGVRERQTEALANYHRRVADLERTVGGPLPESRPPESLPVPSR